MNCPNKRNMKKSTNIISLLSLIVLSLTLTSFAQQNPKPFTIDVTLNGLEDGTVIELVPACTHRAEKPVATAVLKGSKANFSQIIDSPRCYNLRVKDSYGHLQFMIDSGDKMTIYADVTKSISNGEASYNFHNVKIEGSQVYQEFKAKTAEREKLNKDFEEMHKKFSAISQKISKARSMKDQKALDSLYATEEYKQLESAERDFFKMVEESANRSFLENKDSWWGPFLMLYQTAYFTKENRPVFDSMSKEAKDSYYGKLVFDELYPVNRAGNKIPDFIVTNRDGSTVKSMDLIKGNKYVLIDFWASWCSPCRKEIPNLKALYAKYHDKGLQIISISTDKKAQDWEKALAAEQLPWLNFRDVDQSVAQTFKVNAIPAIFLVDGNGILIDDGLRGEALAAKLEELFK